MVLYVKGGEVHLEEIRGGDDVGHGTTVCPGVYLGGVEECRDRKKVLYVAIQIWAQGEVENVGWRLPRIFDKLAIQSVDPL